MNRQKKRPAHQVAESPLSAVQPGLGLWDQRWRVPAVCLVLAVITFAVFGQTLTHGFINYDDSDYVYGNSVVAGGLSLKGLAWVFTHTDCSLYHPLTMLSLMVDYQLHGFNAGGYHFTNVLLHTASVILLFLILRQMTGALWRSAFVAAVFAIHPLRVESVAWVAERKDVLGVFFFMLALGAYVRYVRKSNSLARYLMVVAAFVLALLSKPTVVTLPFVLLLLDYWPLRRLEPPRKLSGLILVLIPLLALGAGACAVTCLSAERHIVARANISMSSRIGTAVVSTAVYLRQMVWPEGLAVFYPQPEKGYSVWTVALSFLLLASITGGVLAFWRNRAWLLTGWLWYLGMLTPMMGIVQVGAFAHADRMTYLPQIGVYVALTWLVAEWGAKWHLDRMAIGAFMTAMLGALIICACNQAAYWKDSETLWDHALDCTTGNYIAHNNLGNALDQEGSFDEAMVHYQEAVQIKPDYADAHFNLGTALRRKGELDEAIAQYKEALRINPDHAAAHLNLGDALEQKGGLDEAISQYQQALQIYPDYAKAHNNLGNAFLQKGNFTEAIAHYQAALKIEPYDSGAQNNLAWLLATCPDASLRNGNRAVELAEQASAKIGGENPIFLHTLAAAYAEAGRFSDAVETAQRASELAGVQPMTNLAAQLQSEMKLYQAGRPFHTPAQAH